LLIPFDCFDQSDSFATLRAIHREVIDRADAAGDTVPESRTKRLTAQVISMPGKADSQAGMTPFDFG
jgi:hypothetical protein